MKKKQAKIIKFNDDYIVMQAVLSQSELTVLKCALRHYNNSYGLSLLKRIEKGEQV